MREAGGMGFTGERFVPSLEGQIKYEHLHRYALVMDFARGKSVLDVASGEGYGAALLARAAESVTGVDNSSATVEHARRTYYLQNLDFLVGECEDLPLADASVDIVTSFETIEHHDKHEEMMSEIKRVLKPGGVLIISSPNRLTYSDEPNYSNPFHVKELYFDEFHKLLSGYFKHVRLYGQRLAAGSFIYQLESTTAQHLKSYSGGIEHLAPRVCTLPSPIYFIAVCSDEALADPQNSVYIDVDDDLWSRAAQGSTIYETQIRRLEEENSQTRDGYEAQIRRNAEELVQVRAAYEAKISHYEDELGGGHQAYQAQIARQEEEFSQARAGYEAQIRLHREILAGERDAYQARQAEYEALLTEKADALHAAQDALAATEDELSGVRAAYEAQLNEYAETLAQAQARLGQLDAALVNGQAKLSAAQARLDKREEVLTWIQTSRSWNVASKLRHFLEQTQEQRGRLVRGLRRLHLLPTPRTVIHGFVDSPAEGERASGELEIVGWAFSAVAPVTRVEAFLDDFYLGQLNYGFERPDVVAAYPEQAPSACGYHERASALAYMAGPRKLTVRVYDAEGNAQLFTRAVVVEHHGAPPLVNALPPGTLVEHEAVAATRPTAPPRAAAEEQKGAATPSVSDEVSELAARLGELIAEFKSREEREPSILSWDVGPDVPAMFPHLAVFTPPPGRAADGLPYLDETVDVVMLSSDDATRVAEARRVASAAVVHIRAPRPGAPGEFTLEAEWKVAACEPSLPSASIIIPVHNKLSFTENCLERLWATLPQDFDGEIILVDDASTDETPRGLERWARADDRIRVLRNDENLGFIGSCNRGAEAAVSEVLVFLNNDTLPQPGWLPPLLRVLTERARAGAVGGKLIYPDGTLQEAGGCIFSDGTGCNFGKHDRQPDAPLYSFLREVDYCSGALLATPRELFLRLGGFDTRFAPAYYEDTDYCFALREHGYRVYYQPESVVVHFEGVTSGTDTGAGVKSYQLVNRLKFVAKWEHALERQPPAPDGYDFKTLHALAVRAGAGEVNGDG